MNSLGYNPLKKYQDFIELLKKYSQKQVTLPSSPNEMQDLIQDLTKLDPHFIKLGQLFSAQTSLLSYLEGKGYNKWPETDPVLTQPEIEIFLKEELGSKVSDLFKEFDFTPLTRTLFAQVHRATLPSERVVAVKIQHPKIKKQILEDLEHLQETMLLLNNQTPSLKNRMLLREIMHLHLAVKEELNNELAAKHLVQFKQDLQNNEHLIIPSPVLDYTTSNFLTMDFVTGQKVTHLTPLTKMDIAIKPLAHKLFQTYVHQIFLDRFVYLDLHNRGTYLNQEQGLVLLDLGRILALPSHLQTSLLKLLLTCQEGKGMETAQALIQMGHPTKNFNKLQFEEQIAGLIAQNQYLHQTHVSVGDLLVIMDNIAQANDLLLPLDLNLVAKTFLNLESICQLLDSRFNAIETLNQMTYDLLYQRMQRHFSAPAFLKSFSDTTEFFEYLPAKLNHFLENVTVEKFKGTEPQRIEKQSFIQIEKGLHYLTTGLILTALILGSAQFLAIPNSFTLWGYPGFALLFFLATVLVSLLFLLYVNFSNQKR